MNMISYYQNNIQDELDSTFFELLCNKLNRFFLYSYWNLKYSF